MAEPLHEPILTYYQFRNFCFLEIMMSSTPCISFQEDAWDVSITSRSRQNLDQLLPSGQTLLTAALIGHHLDTVHLLLQAGASPNVPNITGERPLTLALQLRCVSIVQCLLEAGANPNHHGSFETMTPLQYACYHGDHESLRLLLNHGANPNASVFGSNYDMYNPLRLALHQADESKRHEVTNILLDHGADVNLHDAYGNTPLSAAASMGDMTMVRRLLAVGARLFWTPDTISPMELAMAYGHCKVAAFLIEQASYLELDLPRACLRAAIFDRCEVCLKRCLDSGIDINTTISNVLPSEYIFLDRSVPYWKRSQFREFDPEDNSFEKRFNTAKVMINNGATIDPIWPNVFDSGTNWFENEKPFLLLVSSYGFRRRNHTARLQHRFRRLLLQGCVETARLFCLVAYSPKYEDFVLAQNIWKISLDEIEDLDPSSIRTVHHLGHPRFKMLRTPVIQFKRTFETIQHLSKNPRSLQNCAALAIREALGDNMAYKISKMGLPKPIISHITMENEYAD